MVSDTRLAHLLHVEDDDLDVIGLQRAFRSAKIANPITVAHDGVEALERLRGINGAPRLPRPYLILLDLNMPRMDGITFLKEIRKDPELKNSIVFVMTTSNDDADKTQAYNLCVAGYIVKADPARSFVEATMLLDSYWKIVELPV